MDVVNVEIANLDDLKKNGSLKFALLSIVRVWKT